MANLVSAFCLMAMAWPAAASAKSYFVYVGTYTVRDSKGIYGYRFDSATGKLSPLGVMAQQANPSFIATDTANRFLYASTETAGGPRSDPNSSKGSLGSYVIDARTGALTPLNIVSSGGNLAAHLATDRTGKALFVANYGSGSVASFALNADGSIGAQTGFDQHTGSSINARRQSAPHPHETVMSPDGRFLFVPDLGLDRIAAYRVDAAKPGIIAATSSSVTAGLGPRHMLFAPGGKFAYLICEMGSSVVVLSYDAAGGVLTPRQTISTLPAGYAGENNSAEIAISRDGRHLYASNRGQDSITRFDVDAKSGLLARKDITSSGGKSPRNFALDPTGRYLLAANQDSDTLVVFAVNAKTGALTPTGDVQKVSSPVALHFVPAR